MLDLVQAGKADPNWQEPCSGDTVLHKIVDQLPRVCEAEFEEDDGSDGDSEEYSEDESDTPSFEVLKAFVSAGAKLVQNERGESPLHLLAYYKRPLVDMLEIFGFVLEMATEDDVNSYDGWGKTPLLEAIEFGNSERALQIIGFGKADLNLPKVSAEIFCTERLPKNGTPVLLATARNLSQVALALLEHGAKQYCNRMVYFDYILTSPLGGLDWKPGFHVELAGGNPLHVAALYAFKCIYYS